MMPHPTNVVLVGKKKTSAYAITALRMLTQEGFSEVIFRARGANVYKAVEVAARTCNAIDGAKIERITIGSERLKDKSGAERRVSSIEIVVKKKL